MGDLTAEMKVGAGSLAQQSKCLLGKHKVMSSILSVKKKINRKFGDWKYFYKHNNYFTYIFNSYTSYLSLLCMGIEVN